MEIFAMAADTFTLTNPQNLGFSNRHNTTTSSSSTLTISASISPIDSIAPPITRPTTTRTIPRTCPQKKRRTRRRSQTADYDDGDDNGFFGGDGDDGSFGGSTGGGGGGGGGGGKGWSFYGGNEWEESASSSYSDPAFDFVFQVLSWIVLSNCLHFAFKKIFKVVGSGGFGDPSREKVPMRFISIC
ncbi:hypothetical protein ACHQM5_026452 [Ranunculus cassubicifolius]